MYKVALTDKYVKLNKLNYNQYEKENGISIDEKTIRNEG